VQIIFYSSGNGVLRVGGRALTAAGICAVLTLPLLFSIGYWAAQPSPEKTALAEAKEQQRIDFVKGDAQLHLDALATRLGAMQARLAKLDAVSSQLLQESGLSETALFPSSGSGLGGPAANLSPLALPEVIQELDLLSDRLGTRETQLALLEQHILNRSLSHEVLPSERPIQGGWVSSGFGRRTDPFTGRRTMHSGLDIVNHSGTQVIATATGIVRFAGNRGGYGKMVEIDHGNGYSTRYGHNRELLVKTGELVKKGTPISKLGNTGRSTGPHLHYEVLHNGRPVNPKKFLHASR